jgi:TolB-like protein
MPSVLPSYEYDIFISYRHNDNRSGWVTEFVNALQEELGATIKEPLSIYFDKNPHDGLLETHHVDKSLEGKLKCLIFIPIISQTYCDPKSFAWQQEFCAFNKLSKEDQFGRDIKLSNGNVASRILPIKIHDLDAEDKTTIEQEIGSVLRAIEFIFKSPGVNRPLSSTDKREENISKTLYRDQVNKVANAVKEIIQAMKAPAAKQSPVKDNTKLTSESGREMRSGKIFMAATGLLLFFALIYWLFFTTKPAATISSPGVSKSLVVLPFEDLSPNKDQEWFTDGLTEELLNGLSNVSELKLISRTTAFSFKGKGLAARKIADSLRVSYVLEGSVRKANDMLRITVQLIQASDDSHIWSRTYDYKKDSIFKVQEDIAKNVTRALNILLDPMQKENMFRSGTNNIDAYEELLKGRSFHNEAHAGLTMAPLTQANVHFEKAIALDNAFAEAYFLHSDLFIHSLGAEKNSRTLSGYSDERNYSQIWADLKAAIQYAKTSSKKLSYEFTKHAISNDWSRIPSFINEEFALQPGYENLLILISPEFMAKRYGKEIKMDPFNPQVRSTAALALINKNELDSASALFTNSVKSPGDVFMESMILLHKKEYERGFEVLSENDNSESCQLILLALLAGKYQKSYSQLNQSIDALGFDIGIFTQSPIQIYNAIGEYAKADSLARHIDEKSLGSAMLSNNIITYGLNFHLSATPNLAARLRELGIDPVQFEKEKYYQFPVVQLKH